MTTPQERLRIALDGMLAKALTGDIEADIREVADLLSSIPEHGMDYLEICATIEDHPFNRLPQAANALRRIGVLSARSHRTHGPSTKERIRLLAEEHGVSYEPGKHDAWARDIAKVLGEHVELDATELLIVALQRSGHLERRVASLLHHAYLVERRGSTDQPKDGVEEGAGDRSITG